MALPVLGGQQSPRNRIGAQLGYAGVSSSAARDLFGAGTNASLQVTHRLSGRFSAEFSVGALFMGAPTNENITRELFGPVAFGSKLRILFLALGPLYERRVGDRFDVYVTAGAALYQVAVLLDQQSSLIQFEPTNDHVGVNAGVGAWYRLSKMWGVGLNLYGHRIGTDTRADDLFFRYTNGDEDPWFWGLSVATYVSIN